MMIGNSGVSISVEVGSEVAFGERLGNVAGGGNDAVFYFELRVNGEAIEASAWFGI